MTPHEPALAWRRVPLIAAITPFITPILILIALVISFFKELQLIDQGGPTSLFVWLGVLGLLAGGALALCTAGDLGTQAWLVGTKHEAAVGQERYVLTGIALCASLYAAWLVQSGGSPTAATVAWVIGLVLVLAAAAPADSLSRVRSLPARLHTASLRKAWPVLAVLGIVLVAAALRLPALDSIPGYIHNDEAANGLQARSVADGQVSSLFSNGWANLPMLGFSWDALFFKLFGDNLTSLRLSSAVPGIASIAVTALLGKELFNLRAGLLAAAFLTFNHVHIHFSRVGHHYIQALFAVILTIYLLVLALRYGSRLAAVATGILLSIDIQVYYAGRVAYMIVPLVVVYVLLAGDRSLLRSRLTTIGWLVLGWVVGIAPIGAVILGDWAAFTGRTRDVLVLGGTLDAQNHVYGFYGTHDAFTILRAQLWRVVQTFNFVSDSSEQYGSPHAMLDPVSAALFPGAVAFAVFSVRRAGFVICLISLVSVLIIGGVLTVDPPFWPRLVILPALVALLIGAFIDGLCRALLRTRWLAVPVGLALLGLVGAVGWGNYQWYFNDYQRYVSHNYGSSAPMDIGNYLRPITDNPTVYAITDGNPYIDHQAIQLLAPRIHACSILQGIDAQSCGFAPTHDRIFIVMPARRELIRPLEAKYPGGILSVLKTYADGSQIFIYRLRQ